MLGFILIILIVVLIVYSVKKSGSKNNASNQRGGSYSTPTPPGLQKNAQWYYADHDQQNGPVPYVTVRALIDQRIITPDTLVWREGMPDWMPAKDTELFVARSQPMTYSRSMSSPPPVNGSKPVTGNAPAYSYQAPMPAKPLTPEEIEARKQAFKDTIVNNAKIIGPLAGGGVLLIVLAIIFGITIPSSHYKKGMTAYNAGDYTTAVIEFAKAKRYSNAREMLVNSQNGVHYQNGQAALTDGDYELARTEFMAAGSFQDASDMAVSADRQGHYVEGEAFFSAEDYESAVAEFEQAVGFDDAGDRLRESYYLLAGEQYASGDYLTAAENYSNADGWEDSEEIIITLGNRSLNNNDFANAIQYYSFSSDTRYVDYAQGMDYLRSGNYEDAITSFEAAADLNDAPDRLNESHYCLGIQNLASGNYTVASYQFGEAGSYEGADILELVAEAEDANSDYELDVAVENYSLVPEDFEIEEFDVQARRSIFTSSTASSFAALCSDYEVDSNTIDTRDSGPYGINYSWTTEEVDHDQNLHIECRYEDGSYDVTGTVRLFVFTEYSSLRDFLQYEYYYRTFEMTDLTSVPNSYSLDDDRTSLSFGNNQVTAHYHYEDNYLVGWRYIYDTQTTFVRE